MTVKSLSFRSKPVNLSFSVNPPLRRTRCCTNACQRAVVISLMIVLIGIFFLIAATPLASIIEEKIAQSSTSTVMENYNLMNENNLNLTVNTTVDTNCSLEFINANKLEQDHPCVINRIKQDFLQRSSSSHNVYSNPHNSADLLSAQSTAIIRLLRNQTRGYFVEYNFRDRSVLSNTLYLERALNWSGLLIEADPKGYNKKIMSRNTKTWIASACLSLNSFPYNQMSFMQSNKKDHDSGSFNENVQCFPLYSMLLASNGMSVDFLSLNAGGQGIKILKTIPWKNVNIKTLAVNCDEIPEGEQAIVKYLEKNGFVKIGRISLDHVNDWIFIKDVLQDLREPARHL